SRQAPAIIGVGSPNVNSRQLWTRECGKGVTARRPRVAGCKEVDRSELQKHGVLLPEDGHLLQAVSVVAWQGVGVDGRVHRPHRTTRILPGSERVQREAEVS